MAKVPKGFLRHYVLKLLDEQPMSGSEIMTTISKRTEERWEPSPGSVYPLLSWLNDSSYIKIADFLAEHDERHPDFDETMEDSGPRFRGDSQLPEEARELFRSLRQVRRSSRKIFDNLRKDYSADVVKEAKAAVDELITKLDVLAEKKEA